LLWSVVPALQIFSRGLSPRGLAGCRRAASSLEYCVFAGMLGLTLVMIFQLYGDTLLHGASTVVRRIEQATNGADRH
jgi:hypothetical protein